MVRPRDTSRMHWNECFYEDAGSPSGLRWATDTKNYRAKFGMVAGNKTGGIGRYTEYWNLCFQGKTYFVHRILWELRNGPIPPGYNIDHLNGDGLDNSADNLDAKPPRLNTQNKRMQIDNTSGVTGVYKNVKTQKSGRETHYWMASWIDTNLVQRTKCFNIEKHGDDAAFDLACLHRKNQISRLQSQGLNYTDRHGV